VTTGAALLVVVGAALLMLLAWAAWTLVRLRRLELRVDRAWTALDAQLQRRAGLAATVARYGGPELGAGPAQRLAAAVDGARAPAAGDRELAENALGRELQALPAGLPGVPGEVAADLRETATRIGLARRFYNDAVRDTRALRRRRLTRLLWLRGRRPLPRYFDIDDGLDQVNSRTDGRPRPAPAVPSTVGTRPPGSPPRPPAPRTRGSNP
jgi:hypothetical protein